MASRRNPNVSLNIDLEADASPARKDIARDLDKIEDDAESTVKGIKRAFENLSPELDTSEIRQALDLADQLDGMVANFTVDTDLAEIKEAEAIARSLRSFQGRIDLTVEGRKELADTLNLAESMDQIRKVKVEVQGRQDLEKAQSIADDLERRRTVPIDAQASDLVRLDDQVADALSAGGEAGAEGIAGALGSMDLGDVGSSMAEQLSGSLAAAGPWVAVAGSIGAVFGDEFLQGFNNALPDGRGDTIRALRSNLAESDLVEVGEAGGAAYSSGLTDGLAGAKDAAALIKGELGGIDDDLDLSEVTRQAMALEQVFGTDLAESVAAVDKLLSQGLVKNSEEGFNLLFELGQQTGTQFDEMLELTSEFSTALRALGIEGPRGLKLIGEMVEQGIFPQVDQAGEVFEELNETIISGGAAEALEKIGFNAEAVQDAISKGGPEAASTVAEIAKQILLLDSEADRAAATTEIFGGNMGLLGDEARTAALELFATADGTTQVGNAASDAADKIEGSATGLDRLKRAAVDLGDSLGGTVADGLDTLNSLANLDLRDAAGSALDFAEGLAEIVTGLGPLSAITGLDPFGPLKDGIDTLSGKADELPPKLAHTISKLDETTTASEDLSGGMYDAAGAADELSAKLQGLFSFSYDQLMRDIADATADVGASLEDGATKTIGMSGAIDISTASGRQLQSQMEALNGALVDASVAAANGDITTEQLAAAQTYLSSEFGRVTSAAGVTKDKVEGLRQKYMDVDAINSVTTDFVANTSTAIGNVTALQTAIANIKSKSVTISASISGPTGISASGLIRRARGGPVNKGQPYITSEEGPEIFVPHEDGTIIPNSPTEDILAGNPRARSLVGTGVGAASTGVQRIELVIGSDGSDFGRMVVRAARKGVKNRGGIDVVFAD